MEIVSNRDESVRVMFRFGRELGVCQGEPYKNALQNLKLWSLEWVKIASYCWLKIIRLKKVNNIITAEMPAPFVPREHADAIYFFKEKVKTTQKIPYE